MQPLDLAPIASAAVSSPATASEPGTQPGSERVGVLVVDDDILVRIMVQLGLKRHGFAVWQAATRREAARLYQQHRERIHVVLLDACRPGLDGPATLDVLRKQNPEVPCCFMSSETDEGVSEEMRSREAVYFITKPFLLEHLAKLLRLIAQGVPSNLLPSDRICRS